MGGSCLRGYILDGSQCMGLSVCIGYPWDQFNNDRVHGLENTYTYNGFDGPSDGNK